MSRQNLDIAAEVVEAVAHMNESRLVELTDPEVEWHSFIAQLGDSGVYRGHDGMRDYARDLTDAWEVFSAEIHDSIAVGDVVVLVGQLHYRGKGSGVDTESLAGWMARFREGRIVYLRSFRDPEGALAAVGLPAD
jgi:ketosteroid isomerase-like protein